MTRCYGFLFLRDPGARPRFVTGCAPSQQTLIVREAKKLCHAAGHRDRQSRWRDATV